MSKERNYNIVTGEVKREVTLPPANRRFLAQFQMKKDKENGSYHQPIPKIRKLGISSDSKQFISSYNDG